MSFSIFYLVFIYFYISQHRINCNEEYKYINISSFQEYQINLQLEKYIILKFKNSKLEDIVCQLNEPIKNGIILVYNDLKKIKQDEYQNFINYKWKFNEGRNMIIKSSDTSFQKESDYFFVFYSNQSKLYTTIIIFNELDIKQISTRENFLITQVYSKKKCQISYLLNDFALINFEFNFPQKNNKEISITILNEKKNIIQQFDKIRKDFIYEYDSKEKKNSLYYIIIEAEESYEEVNLNLFIENKKEPEELKSENTISITLNKSNNFSFSSYINILNYTLNEENVIEIEVTKELLSKNFKIKNQLLNDYNTTQEPTETQFNYSIREIKGLGDYYFFIPFKKVNKENKLLIFKIYTEKQNASLNIVLTKRITEFNVSRKNISNFNLTVPINATFRRYFKLKFIDGGIPKNENVIIYIEEKNSLILYQGNLLQKGTNNSNDNYNYQQLFIITKDNINKNNFEDTITIGLRGSSGTVSIQIRNDSNKIIFNNEYRSYNKTFFFELINCKEPLYFIETYDNESIEFDYTIFESFYGDYDISYSPIENIDFLKSKGTNLSQQIFQNNLTSIAYLIQCKTPTFLRLRYAKKIKINKGKYIVEGDEIVGIISKGDTINYKIKGKNKWVLIMESNEKILLTMNNVKNIVTHFCYKIDKENNDLKIESKYNNALINLFISSTSLYTKIIEGNSEIEYSNNKVLFKFRNDILYDYISLEIIPKRGVKRINLFYDLIKMIENEEKFYLPYPTNYFSFENNYTMKFSNPYNKYNSQIQTNESVFLIFNFINKKEDFNIYINIRYYYNNEIQDINNDYIYNYVETNKVYRIFGNNTIDKKYMLVMNVNKCNKSSNFTLISYYEDENNIIKEQNIEKDKAFMYYENLYNNTQLKLKDLQPTQNISDNVILLTYFFLKEEEFNKYSYEKNFKITINDNGRTVNISWSDYLRYEEEESVSTNYSLFILFKNNSLNGICDLINLTPNKTLKDETSYQLYLAEGDYKINIIAFSLDSKFPVYSIYEELIVNIPPRSLPIYVIIIIICFIIIICLFVFIFIYCRKKNKSKKKSNFNVSGIRNNSISNEELIPVDD